MPDYDWKQPENAPGSAGTVAADAVLGHDCFSRPLHVGQRVLIYARPYYGVGGKVQAPGAADKGRVRVSLLGSPELSLTFPGCDLEIIPAPPQPRSND